MGRASSGCIIAVLVIVHAASVCVVGNACGGAPPKAVAGVLDLTGWDFEKDGIVDLSGEYAFYWMQTIDPRHPDPAAGPPKTDGFNQVPGLWNGTEIQGKKLEGDGYATYRLNIRIGKPLPLAFQFPDMATAYRAYANGVEIASMGIPGKTRDTTTARYGSQIIGYWPKNDSIELVLLVSNFHHRKGGAWKAVQLGLEKDVRNQEEKRIFLGFFLFSAIFFMGMYHFALFAIRNRDRPSIFFGFFCLLIAVRSLTQGDTYLMRIFPDMSWHMLIRIEYLSYYMAPPAFALFLYHLYREDFSRTVLKAILAMSALFCVTVLFTPPKFFTQTVPVYHGFTILCSLYGLYLLFCAFRRKREGANYLLIGFSFLFIAIANDIGENLGFLDIVKILPVGLLVFLFFLTILIALRFSRAFDTVEMQREALLSEMVQRKRIESEKQELQERLTRSQKMEAIGLLAGGVAHDLNNIFSGIVTYPDLLLMDLAEDSPLREALETIRDSGYRAAAVVQDLLALARRGILNFEALSLNRVIQDYLRSPEYLRRWIDFAGIEVKTDLAHDLFNIKGSSFHLRKAVMNLIDNAMEATGNGGGVVVSTENRYVDLPVNGYERIPEGSYAVCRIEDRGNGIAAADLNKIFEPFYTTKVMGKSGSGLGLAVVWGTVHDHRGYIDIESSPGKGTSFELYFEASGEACVEAEKSVSVEAYLGNGESILVVDDAAIQRQIASGILKRLGYRVETVESGEAAVVYLEKNSVDLVMLDMIMDPGMDGLETYQRIIGIRPEIRTVIASGYSETDRVRLAQQMGAGPYIKKPYTIEKIGLAIRAELDRNPGRASKK